MSSITRLLLLALVACSAPEPEPEPDDTTPDQPGPADTGEPGQGGGEVDTDDTDADTDLPEPAVDCDLVPVLPTSFHTLQGFGQAEDFDFIGTGEHVSVNNGNLVARDMSGNTRLLVSSVGMETSGTRTLPDGSVLVNRVSQGSIVRVFANGATEVIASGLSYPNGLEVDEDGFAYVAEQSGGRIQRIDPDTLETWVIAEGLVEPNGLIFSPDYDILYFNSFGAGTVRAINKLAPDRYSDPYLVANKPGGGGFDGLNVDECGNVYVTEFVAGKVWRVTPHGSLVDLAVALPSGWIPNLRWGNGVGGWDETVLYVADRDQGRLFGMELGVNGKKAVYWP